MAQAVMPLARASANAWRAVGSSSASISVPSTPTRPATSTTSSYSIDGSVIARSNRRGRAWLPIRSASAKPRFTTSSVRSPLRSNRALVATVVPIFTASTTPGDRCVERNAEYGLDAGNRGIAIAAGVFTQQLMRGEMAVRIARHDVGERAASVDPELPLARCHPALNPFHQQAIHVICFVAP